MDYLQGQEQQSLDPKDYRTIICVFGSRHWKNKRHFHEVVTERLKDMEGPVLFISGAAPSGADDFIIQWCHKFHFPVKLYPAKWQREDGTTDKGAGFARNDEMANVLTEGWSFYDGKSPGTADMIRRVTSRHKPVYITSITIPN